MWNVKKEEEGDEDIEGNSKLPLYQLYRRRRYIIKTIL